MIPYFDGRLGAGMNYLGSRTNDEDYSTVLGSLKKPHLDYFHMFYAGHSLIRWHRRPAFWVKVLRRRSHCIRD